MVKRGHAKPKLSEETGCALFVCHLNLSDVVHSSLHISCGRVWPPASPLRGLSLSSGSSLLPCHLKVFLLYTKQFLWMAAAQEVEWFVY